MTMTTLTLLCALLCALLLTGCSGSIVAVHRSLDAYKACLATAPTCEREQKIFEAELAAYRAGVSAQPAVVLPLGVPYAAPVGPTFRTCMTGPPGLAGMTTTTCY